jgi:hypothetical protein
MFGKKNLRSLHRKRFRQEANEHREFLGKDYFSEVAVSWNYKFGSIVGDAHFCIRILLSGEDDVLGYQYADKITRGLERLLDNEISTEDDYDYSAR